MSPIISQNIVALDDISDSNLADPMYGKKTVPLQLGIFSENR